MKFVYYIAIIAALISAFSVLANAGAACNPELAAVDCQANVAVGGYCNDDINSDGCKVGCSCVV